MANCHKATFVQVLEDRPRAPTVFCRSPTYWQSYAELRRHMQTCNNCSQKRPDVQGPPSEVFWKLWPCHEAKAPSSIAMEVKRSEQELLEWCRQQPAHLEALSITLKTQVFPETL